MKNQAFIIKSRRTPVGGFLGSLSGFTAPELASFPIKDIIETTEIDPSHIDEIILGNVLSANIGQSPARQAAVKAGIPYEVDATTINKVCSSGLKSVSYGAQSIMLSNSHLIIAGGMESMSNTPFYLENHRQGNKAGHHELIDGMIKDGLWDPYYNIHMGRAAEYANEKYDISREEQDAYTQETFSRAQHATEKGYFSKEITPVSVTTRKGTSVIDSDEDISKFDAVKMKQLKPIFDANGSITAANASNLNDGAAAVLLASGDWCEKHHVTPEAKILGFADAAQDPKWFTTSPALSIQKLLNQTGLTIDQIDFFEINEAYANVSIINARILGIDLNKVNVHGGAVALGHPIGASGTRILSSLINVLKQNKGKYGIAAICNGGGGSTAILVQNI